MNDDGKVLELRKRIFLTAYKAGAAHLASAFSVVELLYVLYEKGFLNFDITNPWQEDRDRLILCKGHACLAQYVVLNDVGMITDEELAGFSQPGSHLGGEPKCMAVNGIEASTGSLGHGLSFAVGVAIGLKTKGYDSRVYAILGDGECEEGTVWEAAMCAIKHKLNNLTIILDDNRLQAMGPVKDIMDIDEWSNKWRAFGFSVKDVDGHNIDDLIVRLKEIQNEKCPHVLISHTTKGRGVSFMESVPIWHYRMPNDEEIKIVMKELSISDEEAKECGILI